MSVAHKSKFSAAAAVSCKAKTSPFSPNLLVKASASVQITKITGASVTHGAHTPFSAIFSFTAGSVIM